MTESKETLQVDYQEASEDARYRDRLLYSSYYLAIILLVFIIQLTVTVITHFHMIFAASVLFGGGVLYLLLTAWAIGVKESRNASWKRRKEIEKTVEHLNANSYADVGDTYKQTISKELDTDIDENTNKFKVVLTYLCKNFRLESIVTAMMFMNPNLIWWLLLPVTGLMFTMAGLLLLVSVGNTIVALL